MKKKFLLVFAMVSILTLGVSQLALAGPTISNATCSLKNCFNNPVAVSTCQWLVDRGFCPPVGGVACCFV